MFWDRDGVCIGSAGDDLYYSDDLTLEISDRLKHAFVQWHDEFENDAGKKPCPIDWVKYNQRGRELTTMLQKELGDNVEVVYEDHYESE